jgi:hypothetical protein
MIEFPTIPSDAHYKKDLNDCTAGDLEYLINIRKTLHEITGVEHCAERLDETRHFEIIAKGMRALDISTVRDIPTAWPSKRR